MTSDGPGRAQASRRRQLSQSFEVAYRRLAKVPLVLPVEVRGVIVPDSVARLRNVGSSLRASAELNGRAIEWMEKVTDEQYQAGPRIKKERQ